MINPVNRIKLLALTALLGALAVTGTPAAAAGTTPPTCYIATDGVSGVIAIYGHGADSAWCADNRVAPGQHVYMSQLPDRLALICTTDGGQAAMYDDAAFPDGTGFQMCTGAMATPGAVVIWNKS